MLMAFVLFWLLIVWGLIDSDIDGKEAAIFVGIWLALMTGFALFKVSAMWFVVPTVGLDIILLFKVLGPEGLSSNRW